MSEHSDDDALLNSARRLVERLEAGNRDTDTIQQHLDELTRIRETQLFRELGQLTRDLHEALKAFRVDSRLTELAGEIPDAQDRLTHVITMTEQSAHRTLTAIEESLPTVGRFAGEGGALFQRWRQFRSRELSAEQFRELSRDLEAFLQGVEADAQQVQNHLTDALMAQDYQDLTGQIIRRVINLVQEVETSLVSLISLAGQGRGAETAEAADNRGRQKEGRDQLEGPQVPGRESAGTVTGQDEVDDLLSSLGF